MGFPPWLRFLFGSVCSFVFYYEGAPSGIWPVGGFGGLRDLYLACWICSAQFGTICRKL